LGRIRPNLRSSPSRASLPARPTRPVPRAPARASSPADRPAPPVSCAFPLFLSHRSPASNPGPPVRLFVPARDFTGAIPADHPPSPCLLATTPAPVKLGTAPPLSSLCLQPAREVSSPALCAPITIVASLAGASWPLAASRPGRL
jgi:hypothetical protein